MKYLHLLPVDCSDKNLPIQSILSLFKKQKFDLIRFSFSESSPAKKRPVEKENCSISPTGTNADSRTSSPYVTAIDQQPYRSSLFSIEWYRSNIPRLLRRLVPIPIRENIIQ